MLNVKMILGLFGGFFEPFFAFLWQKVTTGGGEWKKNSKFAVLLTHPSFAQGVGNEAKTATRRVWFALKYDNRYE